MVAEEPDVVVAEEPAVVVAEEPEVVVAEEPDVVVVEEPAVAVEEPAVVVAEEPAVAVEEPAVVVVEEPAVVVVEEQEVAVEEPAVAVVEEQEVAVEEEPVALVAEEVTEEPAMTVEEPAVAENIIFYSPKIPKIVFIIPYRDREHQKEFYSKHMKMILEDISTDDYKIYFIHQKDEREFNRGAMKNIGFIILKNKYPNDYKNITLVFNDIDIMPLTKNFIDYNTVVGTVKHFYGFDYTLGGIVSINAEDFERINGFPNYWTWGYEDNMLQKRVKNANIVIDRTNYYPVLNKHFLLLHDGFERTINKNEFNRYLQNVNEGIQSITNLSYNINEENGLVDVTNFQTEYMNVKSVNVKYNLSNGANPFGMNIITSKKRNGYMRMVL